MSKGIDGVHRVFNTGSPYNVPAGHGADLRPIQEHYRKMAKKEVEEQKRWGSQKKD